MYFYAENVDGEYRAGIRSEPVFPIGDIQIRADDNAMVLLGPETAIDDMPNSTGLSAEPYIREDATAEERAAFESAMATTNDMLVAAMSPYRALQGQEALDLLNQVVNSERVIYRMVGANVALSQTGEFEPDSSLATALANCDIPVDIEPDAPLSQETDGRGQNEIDDYEYD